MDRSLFGKISWHLRFVTGSILVAVMTAAAVFAQGNQANTQYAKAKLDLSSLSGLEDKAESVAEVNVDRKTLRLAEKFLKSDDPEEAKVKELIRGIEGIWVKVYEFEKDGDYNSPDFEKLRSQLNNPAWTRLAGVKSRKKDKIDVEVAIMTDDNDNILGLSVIALEPKQLAVVNIVGNFDPARIRELSGKFKIPDLDLEGIGVMKKKGKDDSKEKDKAKEKAKDEKKD